MMVFPAGVLVVSLVAGMPAPPGGPASESPQWRPKVQTEHSVPGRGFTAKARPADPKAASVLHRPPSVTWPTPGTAEVSPTAATPARAGRLPVLVGAGHGQEKAAPASRVARVQVRMLDRSAAARVGVSGVVLTVGRADGGAGTGHVTVDVDYSSFRSAYGGDWASRVRLVRLPACALATPEKRGCSQGEVLPSRNAVHDGRVSADVPVSGEATVLAATAGPSGSSGDYKATALSSSASWEAGDSSGDFSWSYPIDASPGLEGPEPDLDLAYSSSAVDGRVASTNNQASWIGEGWDLGENYIERRYKSCADDVSTTPKPQDLCWETDNAYMTLGNKAVELVRDDATGEWHPRSDDGTRVQRLTGASNGDNDGEHWKVTTLDGTQYFFGLNRLPGWATGNEVTNSTWTAPVFGNDTGEPCHGSTFATSSCTQAWRWNLDYVVDPQGNAASYFYGTETNYYGRNLTATDGTQYVRGGYLKRIDYGQRSTTMYSAAAPMRVSFGVEERCATGATCGTETITAATAKNWPDVPYDQNCAAGATCTGLYAPTFWTRKRLASVTTQLWVSGTTYRDVETWALGHEFRDPGDGTSPALWLSSITETGKVGGTAALSAVTFQGLQMANRVDAAEGIPPMYKWRLTDIYNESGGHVRVNYSGPECTSTTLPAVDQNTKRCFPQYWQADGSPSLTLDWFHKYVPVQVLEDDQAGVAGIEETDYEYLGGGAWHYDDDELTPTKYRTWGQWRGFAQVRVTHGAPGETRSQSDTLHLRGMDGDKLANGGTRKVTVTDSQGGTITDQQALAGWEREDITYNGPGGAVLDDTITDPWISDPTATHGTTVARMVRKAAEREREALAAGGWRNTETQTTYDTYGLPTEENDLGDTSTAADDQCTRTTYTRNTSTWLIDFTAREETVGVACTATPSYPKDAVSDDLTYYDGATSLSTPPTRGDETLTKELASYSGSTPVYAQNSRATYDSYGRPLDEYDPLDRKTSTAYTPASGAPATTVTVTNPAGNVTTTTEEPAWGEPTAEVDANGKRTDLTRDPLGRLTAVWLPDRSKSGNATPNFKFTYLLRQTAPSVVTTEEIRDDGSYDPTYEFYDGQLRTRQTQAPAPDGGRVVTDTFYDSRGLESKSNGAYWNSGTAGTTLLAGVTDTTVPGQDVTTYDGAEREVADIFRSYGTEKWRTTTTYGGDRVSVDPPDGETPTTSITDADDKVTELRQYTGGSPTGSYDATTYTYTSGGDLATVKDPAGNTWQNTYDLRGRLIKRDDPDKGTATMTYDAADQLLTTTDARNKTLAYTYDGLGRKTGVFDDSPAGTKRAEWKYDTLSTGTVLKGVLASSTRYVGGNAYTTSVDAYDSRYRPLSTTTTIPASEGALAGSYKVNTGYTATGLASSESYPAAGDLAAETLRFGYDNFGRLQTAQSGLGAMLTAATYTPYGEPAQLTLSAATGKQLVDTLFYDDATRRLARTVVDRNTAPQHLSDIHYTYDPSGNVTKIADTPVGGTADTQCFRNDYLQRLTEAWTATDDCASDPSTSNVGGPDPYWQSWSYDKTGNRLTETNHDPGTGAATTSNYNYPPAGSADPHALSSVTTGPQVDSFGYDAAGDTDSRVISGSQQDLTWDAEGHLATLTEKGQTTSYLYDADGERLISRDPNGTTLYLGDTELRLPTFGSVTATRYYDLGTSTGVRTAGGLSFETADPHGTADLAVNATDLSYQQRRFLPFGKPRGAAPGSWPDDHGYVGGVSDLTGLDHLGAREYDPDHGRFISVDPILDTDNPQQMNAYAYAGDSPVTADDADGLMYCACDHYTAPAKKKKKKHHQVVHHYCDGCDYQKYMAKKKKKKHHQVVHHYCDGCDYQKYMAKKKKHRSHKHFSHYCDGCDYQKYMAKKKKQRGAAHRPKSHKTAGISLSKSDRNSLIKAGGTIAACVLLGARANTCAVLGGSVAGGSAEGDGWPGYIKYYLVGRGIWTGARLTEPFTGKPRKEWIKLELEADLKAVGRVSPYLWLIDLKGDTSPINRKTGKEENRYPSPGKLPPKSECVFSWRIGGHNIISVC
jgi:RHS repeat-associated protein